VRWGSPCLTGNLWGRQGDPCGDLSIIQWGAAQKGHEDLFTHQTLRKERAEMGPHGDMNLGTWGRGMGQQKEPGPPATADQKQFLGRKMILDRERGIQKEKKLCARGGRRNPTSEAKWSRCLQEETFRNAALSKLPRRAVDGISRQITRVREWCPEKKSTPVSAQP